ncbi:S66 peptidase family protein [Virgibacillus necropolis]|uniref:LD-carboxypeptidase n=1 Tax=Virgibacillus necropolis TaxID=163877 RepID=A0A221M8U9_9BACI|nr:LD-carboxypeptidase [Virgibacillus necropolis]ASN04078.1 LD-carboxypeptidase [Virgibacillus necropolis]
MLLPQRLQIGDTIGVIAPAGPPNIANLKRAIPVFQKMGLGVRLGTHINNVNGYLAGTDEERLSDLHNMFADPAIKAIIFARGGYGTARIAPNINYNLIQQNPKIMWGYSDITFLHTTIYQATGLVTFHGPMVASDVGKDNFHDLSLKQFEQLFEPATLVYSEIASKLTVINHGIATAPIVGGNLSLLASTIGTPYEIDTKGKLLLIEDVDEVPYKIDGMLNQLKQAGKLANAAGILVGDFANAEPKEGKHSLTLEHVFYDYFSNLLIPIVSGFKIGHCQPHFAIPLGTTATIDTFRKIVKIDPGVR